MERKRRACVGRTTKNGYICVLVPNHPYSFDSGYVYEHRLVMEMSIKRFLKSEEDVHHRDGDKMNNKLKNLQLLLHSDHSRINALLKPRNKLGRFMVM